MKKITTFSIVVSTLAIISSASADDPRSTERKVKPSCTIVCETCSRCIEQSGDPLYPCARYEYYQCNCHEECY